jgi:hypothetical protein
MLGFGLGRSGSRSGGPLDHVEVNLSMCLISRHTSKESGFGGLAPHILKTSDEILISVPRSLDPQPGHSTDSAPRLLTS